MVDEPKGGQADPDPAKVAAEKAVADKAVADAAAKTAADAAAKKATDDAAAAAAAAGKTPKAPASYALTMPKGAEAWLADSDLANIAKIAKENDWTNEEAQARLEDYADQLVAQSATFKAEVEGNKDYGGEKLVETQRLANLVIDRVRPKGHARAEAFKSLLVRTGYGNNIEVLSFLADLGKLMAEDRPEMQSAGAGGKRTPEEVLYGAKG